MLGMRILRLVCCVFFALSCTGANAQVSTEGSSFWFGFMANSTDGPEDELEVTITSSQAASGVIEVPGQNWSQTFFVDPNSSIEIAIPDNIGEVSTEQFIDSRAIHIETNVAVSVFASNYAQSSADASRILPQPVLGTKYIAASYAGLNGAASQLLIVATEAGTEIQITPSVTTSAGSAAGVPFTVQMGAGQCYRIAASGTGDLTGTQIMATAQSGKCRPFAVFGGAVCANIPNTCFQACDHLYEQLYDLDKWGRNYVLAPFEFLIDPNYSSITQPRYSYRIIAALNGTNVVIDDVTAIVLQAGQFQEFNNETIAHEISADQPVMVVQYMEGISCAGNGDPAMVILDDIANTSTSAIINANNFGAIDTHYISVVIGAAGLGSFALDDVVIPSAQFQPVGAGDAHWVGTFDLTPGQHSVTCNTGFNGILFGHASNGSITASYAESLPVTLIETPIIWDQTVCSNAGVSLDVPANYASPRWYYVNDPGALLSTSNPLVLSAPIQNAAYELHAEDLLSGCVDTFYYSVESPNPFPVVITQDQLNVCSFENVTLTALAQPSTAIYQYEWLPGGQLLDDTGAIISVQAEESATYEVIVSTPSGCAQTSASATIVVNPGDVASFNAVEDQMKICHGASVDLHVEAERLVWHDNFDPAISWGDWQSILGGEESIVCGTVNGNGLYFNGAYPREAVTQPLDLSGGATMYFSLKIANGTAPCDDAEPGDNVVLAYSVANGPWINLQTFYESAYPDFAELSVVLPAAACNPNTRIRWRQNGSYTANQDNWVLENAYVGQMATAAYNYTWAPTIGLSSAIGATISATPAQSTWYEVTMTDPITGCDYTDSVLVDVGQPFSLSVTPDVTICYPQDVLLTAIPSELGSYTYEWSPALNIQGPFSFNTMVSAEQTQTYTVTAISDYGCEQQNEVTITLGSLFDLEIVASDDSLCAGETVSLEAILTGQSNGITFTWSGDPTLSSAIAAQINAQPTQDAVITCLAEQSTSGCSVQREISIDVVQAFSVSVSPDVIQTCQAAGTSVEAAANTSEPVQWSWSPADWVADANQGATALVTEQSGILLATATTFGGCVASDSLLIEVSPLITNLGVDTGLCIGQTLQLSLDWPAEYDVVWSTGSVVNTIIVDESATYSVSVLSPNGCSSRDTIVVEVFDFPELDLGPDTATCLGGEIRLTASDPGFEYLWSTGQLSRQIFVTEPGVYDVQVTNGYCYSYDTIAVEIYELPVQPFLPHYTYCFEANPEPYYLDAENQGCTFVWNNDSTSHLLRIDGPGTYSVWVTTQQGCALEFETEFEQECQEAIYAPNSFTPDGDGINDAWFVYGADVVNFHVQIYNRWGEMFFDSHDIRVPWLGQRRDGNQYVDSEVYDYIIRYQKVEANGSLSPEVVIKGSIALIR